MTLSTFVPSPVKAEGELARVAPTSPPQVPQFRTLRRVQFR